MPAPALPGIAEKKGKLRPIDMKKVPPSIRLVSSAAHERHILRDTTGVPMNSTYRATLADPAADAACMRARCVATREEVRRHDMVRAAGRALPTRLLDEIADETRREAAAETARRERATLAESARSLAKSQPLATPALDAFSKTLAAEPRHPASQTMLNQFFSSGSADGPFPGSKSEMGMVLAGAYWVDRGANSTLIMGPRQPHHAPDGNRLHNHNFM